MYDIKMMRSQGKTTLGIKYNPRQLIDKWHVKPRASLQVDGQIGTQGIQIPVSTDNPVARN